MSPRRPGSTAAMLAAALAGRITELETELRETQRGCVALVAVDARLTRDHATMLETLTHAQARGTALLDENRGWRSAFTRRIDSEYPSDFAWPVRFVEPGSKVLHVLADVIAERWRQDAKWDAAISRVGIPDGTGSRDGFDAEAYAMAAKEACDNAFAKGKGAFLYILAEEFAEVVAETEPAKLRAELVQVAATAALWCEVIDLRAKEPT